MEPAFRLALILCTGTIVSLAPAPLPAQQLYWSQFGTPSQVGHVNLDGSGSVTLVQPNQVFAMETLDTTRQVYWIDNGAATIVRANADFTGLTPLVTGLGSGYHLNLALDPGANLIFWSNADTGTIGRASLSGGPVLGTFASPGSYPDELAVDAASQFLYWSTQSGEIVRSRFDGTSQLTVLSLAPYGASGLDLDLAAGKMYLAVPNDHKIVRANLDGTGLETLLNLGTERPFGMELFNGRMYWTDLDGGRLRSANLNGTGATTILSGLSLPRQVSIMPIPEPGTAVVMLLGAVLVFVLRRNQLSPAQRSVQAGVRKANSYHLDSYHENHSTRSHARLLLGSFGPRGHHCPVDIRISERAGDSHGHKYHRPGPEHWQRHRVWCSREQCDRFFVRCG